MTSVISSAGHLLLKCSAEGLTVLVSGLEKLVCGSKSGAEAFFLSYLLLGSILGRVAPRFTWWTILRVSFQALSSVT